MKGHRFVDCPNPAAKRLRTEEANAVTEEQGYVILDGTSDQNRTDEDPKKEEQANVVRFGGCAILDSGASTGVTSLEAVDAVQQQRLASGEPGEPTLSPSDRRFRFGDGSSDSASNKVTQPVTAGILKGHNLDFHLIDKKGNETLPLYPISEMRKSKMVVDYEQNMVMFKDQPGVWHQLPTTGGERGLILIPLTQEAVEKYSTEPHQANFLE